MSRPSLELVRRRDAGKSPFDALLVAAEHDPEAAEGLALAYASLDQEQRRALVASVVRDAGDAGRSPAHALALLLAVEKDRELAGRIAAAIASATAPSASDGGIGWAWGSTRDGGVALAVGAESPWRLARVTWRAGCVDGTSAEPRCGETLDQARSRLGVPESADALALDAAVDLLAEQLWRARRTHGSLPPSLRALAHLFVPYR